MYPRLFQLGPVTFPTYGVFAAIALLAGLWLAMRTAARIGVAPGAVWNFGLITIFTAVLGTRLLFIAGHWHDFLAYPLLMLGLTPPRTVDSVLTELGLGIFAGLLYLTSSHMPWLLTLDAAVPGWALGHAILALGCFFAGCDYGHPTTMPWGITFHSRWAALWNGTPLQIKLQPVQLYLALMQVSLCLLLLGWLPRRRQPGELVGAWMVLAGLSGFFLDYYRGDNRLMVFSGAVLLAQAIDFCIVVVGALILLQRNSVAAQRPLGEAMTP